MKKKEIVAMLLAGGQGSRLKLLTERLAKPGVTFGGKYRIIDFPLSNCINSGIETVGVLTQYQPLMLNEYIGNGQPWDLDRTFGGVTVLQPYQGAKRADWYKGTANAIYQNIHFMSKYEPEYVIILSGDHIYKMDYRAMLVDHKKNDAACTIAVIDVPLSEASRFGIMNTNDDMSVYEFEEKPASPKSTKASMGVYIFTAEKLFSYLTADNENPNSENDFGKNIIPAMLEAGERMFAYSFDGYWKDVGTLESLWEANMDLLGESPAFSLSDYNWKIYSRNYAEPPHYSGSSSIISNSLITEGCSIHGTVINSVLSSGVTIAPGAVVRDSIIMSGVTVGKGSTVDYSIIDSGCGIGAGCAIGRCREEAKGLTLLGSALDVPGGTVIPDTAIIDRDKLKLFLEGGVKA